MVVLLLHTILARMTLAVLRLAFIIAETLVLRDLGFSGSGRPLPGVIHILY